ncbi:MULTISPECIES: extracellular solute-binding protein [unclassified Streptomyces]|uniref:ABC transporter substrate-binding protein n=1 Tax=unclassified Streptomyces TaxID=2593676 RepID=UPI00037E806C|nr:MULTISPECIES: extracellular solute-binding protein [unclassified Streptomyces]
MSGCGADDATVTLNLLLASYDGTVGTSIEDRWDAAVKAFEEKHPDIRVAVERVPFLKLDATLARRVKDGRAPDISEGNFFAAYAEDGRLYPAGELFDVPVQANFIDSFADAGQVDSVQYGIPTQASAPRLFFNAALFEQAGRSGAPTSWDELHSCARALRRIGVATPYALTFGPEAAEDELLAWLLAGDGGYSSATGYAFVSAENEATLTWLRDRLVGEGLAGTDPAKLTRTQAYAQFLQGKVGMLLAHPVLLGAARQAGLKYATAAFPKRDGEGAAPPVGLNDWLMAFRANGRRAEAKTFLTFLFSSPAARTYGTGTGTLPATVSDSEELGEDRSQRELWPFVRQLPDAEFHPVGLESWPTVRSAIRERIGSAVTSGGRPRDVLEALDRVGSSA